MKTPNLQILYAFIILSILMAFQPSFAFDQPWDQGHDTARNDEPDDPGTCEGSNCDPCKSSGSPVYIPTGHFVWGETDIILAGHPQVSISRSYNSHDPRDGIFGNGWSSNCEPVIIKVDGGDSIVSYILRVSNGKRYEYKQQADGTIASPAGRFDSISVSNNQVKLTNQGGSYREFNTTGRISKWVDPNGISREYKYDSEGKITKILSNTRSLALTYNSNGRVINIQDHSGRKWTYSYDFNGNLISITDPLGGVRQFEYQAYTDSKDGFTYYQLTKITDESGVVVTQVSYDDNRVSSYTAGTNTYRYSYNINTKTVTKTDGTSRRRTYVYNDDQVITKKTDPLNNTASFEYNSDGKLTKFTDKLGKEWTSTFGNQGRKLTSSSPLGRTAKWEYNGDSPKPVKIITPLGNTSIVEYDAKLNPIGVTDAKGNKSTLVFDANGNITSTKDAKGSQTTFLYNNIGLLTKITDAKSNSITFAYDLLARKTSSTDAEGRTTTYEYDVLDRLTKTTNALGHTTSYTYDSVGRMLTFTDPVGNVTQNTYDAEGRLSKVTRPDSKETTYVYDAANLLTTVNRYDGKTINLAYDAVERLTSSNVDGDTISYTYNARGDLTKVSNTTGNILYTFNDDGELTAENQLNTQIDRQYNNDGALKQLSALGKTYTYSRDKLNTISELTDGTNQFSFSYDVNNALTAINLPNTLSETYSFDKIYNITNINTGNESLGYTYDKTGLITQKTLNSSSTNYTYDEITRLIQAGADTYNYDTTGNNLNNGAKYDSKTNKLTENNEYTFTYDVSGNLSKKVKKDSSQTKNYTFNSRNQLIKVETLDQSNQIIKILEFVYGPLGRRFSKTDSGTVKRYVYDGDNILAVLDSSGATTSLIMHGDSIDVPLSITTNGNTYYYHRDHQGSIIALTDKTRTTVEGYTYNAYGVTSKTSTVNTGNPFGYTGREYDDDDLYYYRARYYDPTLQTFISEDPIYLAAGDYNHYRYVMNDPVNQTDSSGLFLDTFLDVGFILYDVYKIVKDNVINGCDNLSENFTALAADIAGAAVPFATGGGMAVRGAKHGDELFDIARCAGGKCTVPGMCFVAGTLVHTKDGIKPIEKILVGDLVASKDESSSQIAWKPVVGLIRNYNKDILNLKLVDEEGVEETLGVTPEHPFWVKGKKWVNATDLAEGMLVTTRTAKRLKIKSISKDTQKYSTYNFEVADFHTYFVGKFGAWVHNTCPDLNVLSEAASAADRGGLTKAGRGLQKHGGRSGSAFPKAKGSPSSINQQGQNMVDDILTTPGSTTTNRHHGRFGDITEVRTPDGRGIRYDGDGNFIGFLEP